MGTPINSQLVRTTGKTTWSLWLVSKMEASLVGLSPQPVGSDAVSIQNKQPLDSSKKYAVCIKYCFCRLSDHFSSVEIKGK